MKNKHVIGLCVFCLIAFKCFSAPSFLEGWNIPSGVDFNAKCAQTLVELGGIIKSSATRNSIRTISEIEYVRVVYSFTSEVLTEITLDLPDPTNQTNQEHVEFLAERNMYPLLPPFFAQRNLSWSTSYNGWVDAFTTLSEFKPITSFYPQIEYGYLYTDTVYGFPKKQITATIEAVLLTDTRYKLRLAFNGGLDSDERTEYTLTDFSILYKDSGWNTIHELDIAAEKLKGITLDTEYYAKALSSNLIELNRASHMDFGGIARPTDAKSIIAMLKNTWSINNREELLKTIEQLRTGGQNGSYQKLIKLIDDNGFKDIKAIIDSQHMSILDANRLYFASYMRSRLGPYGIEAWDLGRALNLIRWGTAAGYIDLNEAKTLYPSIVETLINHYHSYEDYMAHYIAGRGFFGLSSVDHFNYVNQAINAALRTIQTHPFHLLPFPAKETAFPPMSISESYYVPPNNARPWIKAIRITQLLEQGNKSTALQALKDIRTTVPNSVALLLLEAGILEEHEQMSDLFPIFLEFEARVNASQIASIRENETIDSYRLYAAYYALKASNPAFALKYLEQLPPIRKDTSYVQSLFGWAYILQNDTERAIRHLLHAEDSGYLLPAHMQKWLRANGR